MLLLSYACYEGFGHLEQHWGKVVSVLWMQRVAVLYNAPRLLLVVIVYVSRFPRDGLSSEVLIVIQVLGMAVVQYSVAVVRDGDGRFCE